MRSFHICAGCARSGMLAHLEVSVEHVLVFALLCVCVLYICKVLGDFRDMGLRVRRDADEEDGLDAVEEHSD